MTEKELDELVKKKIRALDKVLSTGTLTVVRPEDKYEPLDEDLIDEEKEDWDPWR
jgi:hypothetical protein